MNKVTIQYFAVLRELAGRDGEELETQAATADALFDELARRYAFPEFSSVKVAINDEFADWESPLRSGDTVVFIPPVAGG